MPFHVFSVIVLFGFSMLRVIRSGCKNLDDLR